MLGTMSGTSPGTQLPGGLVTLPINWDFFTDFLVTLINTPVFMDFIGVLDADGRSTAQANTFGPLPTGSAGIVMHYAYALNQPWDFVSEALAIEIVD